MQAPATSKQIDGLASSRARHCVRICVIYGLGLLPVPVVPLQPFVVLGHALLQPLAPFIGEMPIDGLLDADLERRDRIPVKLHIGLMGVDRVTLIVAMPIGNVGDEGFGLAKLREDALMLV